MNTLVIKFGGASVANLTAFASISDLIMLRMRAFDQVVVVVSAMGDTTDQLAAMARSVNPLPPKREYDMLLSAGERISISLLAWPLPAKAAWRAASQAVNREFSLLMITCMPKL